MRKRHETECDKRRNERLEKNAQDRSKRASAEDASLDAAVRRSIRLHGAWSSVSQWVESRQ